MVKRWKRSKHFMVRHILDETCTSKFLCCGCTPTQRKRGDGLTVWLCELLTEMIYYYYYYCQTVTGTERLTYFFVVTVTSGTWRKIPVEILWIVHKNVAGWNTACLILYSSKNNNNGSKQAPWIIASGQAENGKGVKGRYSMLSCHTHFVLHHI